jgi:hypothetical protein
MSTTIVVTREVILRRRNDDWARCITELFTRHNLSLRGAEDRAEGTVTKSYLSEWTMGKVPEYRTAVAFLGYFPHDEAIECLRVAGYPPPEEWVDPVPGPLAIPDEVRRRVAEAGSRDAKIHEAWLWVNTQTQGGSAGTNKFPVEAKLALVRMFEKYTGAEVLPPEII